MQIEANDSVHFRSRRVYGPQSAKLEVSYRAASETMPWRPPAENLERFLTERYCLYTVRGSRVYRAHIHHESVPLQRAEAQITINTMAASAGLHLASAPDLLHYADFLDVLVWAPERPV